MQNEEEVKPIGYVNFLITLLPNGKFLYFYLMSLDKNWDKWSPEWRSTDRKTVAHWLWLQTAKLSYIKYSVKINRVVVRNTSGNHI